MSEPLDLDELERRANGTAGWDVTSGDVLALVVEVRRLRAALERVLDIHDGHCYWRNNRPECADGNPECVPCIAREALAPGKEPAR